MMSAPHPSDTPTKTPSPRRGILSGLASAYRRLGANRDGMAAVEFGLIAPILLVMFLGIVELARAIQMHRRFVSVSHTVADLVAREDEITAADINAIYTVVEHAMWPYDTEGLRISISPMVATGDDGTQGVIYPSTNGRPAYNGGNQRAQCSTFALTPNLSPVNTGVVVVEAEYDFEPLLGEDIIPATTWEFETIQKPRAQVACISFDGVPGCGSCP